MPSDRPLLASDRRESSTHSDERAAEEDTALLGSQRKDAPKPQSRARSWRELGLFTWAVVATAAVIVLAVVSQHQASKNGKKAIPAGKRNLIFMVSDGMGPASLSLTRSFRQFEGNFPFRAI